MTTEMPHNPEAEASVLGTILTHADKVPVARQALPSEAFYTQRHRSIYDAICAIDDAGETVEPLRVMDHMQSQGTLEGVGSQYVASLVGVHIESSLHIHISMVLEKFQKRRLHQICKLGSVQALEVSKPGEAMAWIQDEVSKLESTATRGGDKAKMSHILKDCYRMMDRAMSGDREAMPTGIKPIDDLLQGGLVPGFNYVVGALSGHGKTTLASAMAVRFAQTHPDAIVHWYSSEVPEAYQAFRLMGQMVIPYGGTMIRLHETDIRDPLSSKVKNMDEHQARIIEVMAAAKRLNLSIFRQGTIDTRDVRNRTRATRSQFPDKPMLVVVDYIQNATAGHSDNRVGDVGAASGMLREVAIDSNVIMMTLTQFTEQATGEPIPMPHIRNARYSKDIENDATEYLVYHRPFLDDVCVLQQAKSRYGTPGHTILKMGGLGYERTHQQMPEGIRLTTRER